MDDVRARYAQWIQVDCTNLLAGVANNTHLSRTADYMRLFLAADIMRLPVVADSTLHLPVADSTRLPPATDSMHFYPVVDSTHSLPEYYWQHQKRREEGDFRFESYYRPFAFLRD